MPLYDFECDSCNKEFEQFFMMNEGKKANCPHCNGQARRLYTVGAPNFGFKPYWSDNLDPRPNQLVYVESLAQKKELMKKYGLEESGRRDGNKRFKYD